MAVRYDGNRNAARPMEAASAKVAACDLLARLAFHRAPTHGSARVRGVENTLQVAEVAALITDNPPKDAGALQERAGRPAFCSVQGAIERDLV